MKLGPWPKKTYKLTIQQVRELREDYMHGMTSKAGAEKYGITAAHFRLIGRGKRWKQN